MNLLNFVYIVNQEATLPELCDFTQKPIIYLYVMISNRQTQEVHYEFKQIKYKSIKRKVGDN